MFHSSQTYGYEIKRDTSMEPKRPSLEYDLTELHADIISELAHYKHKYNEAEQARLGLELQIRQLQSILNQTQGGSEEMSRALRSKVQQNIELRKRLNDRADLESYLPLGCSHALEIPSAAQFVSEVQEMKERVSLLSVLNDSDKPPVDLFHGQSADLENLLRTVWNGDSQSDLSEFLHAVPHLDLNTLIQALTGAAIHLWVFQAEFHSYSTMITPLLQKYRDHIATLCKYH